MYKASFYENDAYLKAVSDEFMKLAQGHTYQYFDLTVGNKSIYIKPTAPHPPHEHRWEMCISKGNELLFKGSTVLDIGGAEGFYSIKASLLGASAVTMVERSGKAIACAQFITNFLGIKNIDFVCQDIKDFEFRDFDIMLLMRIVHWFNEAHSISEQDRDRILHLVGDHLKKVCFVNLDAELIDEFHIIFKDYVKKITFGGDKFMGHMELWK